MKSWILWQNTVLRKLCIRETLIKAFPAPDFRRAAVSHRWGSNFGYLEKMFGFS